MNGEVTDLYAISHEDAQKLRDQVWGMFEWLTYAESDVDHLRAVLNDEGKDFLQRKPGELARMLADKKAALQPLLAQLGG